ncbi:[protein-PII] uridylyltransferase [Elioraea rosea]|uniref:[protein-PII] uridylyltransferase n=1 Tax=Elioraea rosea TaxID=2492390 RepID=UPI001EF407FC|nr:[protein-PII] uridylyltransferase [Elioraea rosea]
MAEQDALVSQLQQDLAALSAKGSDPGSLDGGVKRDRALALFRRHLGRIQADTKQRFEQGLGGLDAAKHLSGQMDGMVRTLLGWTTATVFPPGISSSGEALALAATGGYGRGVLAPFSDIDLLFLTPWKEPPRTEQVVEFMLYFLWDLGLKVGHATRSLDECIAQARADATIRTSLVDARFLGGDGALFQEFRQRFRTDCAENGAAAFIGAKRAEREERHRKFGDNAFLVEPNVKDGKGGLRDLQTLYWIGRYVTGADGPESLAEDGLIGADEARAWRRAAAFLWSVRFHLHYATGRAEERLTFDLQPVIGAAMGYTRHGPTQGVERFMKHYFLTAREVRRLTLTVEPAIERAALGAPAVQPETTPSLSAAGFALLEGQVVLAEGRSFADEPILMFRALRVSRDTGKDLHPLTLRALVRHGRNSTQLRNDPEANAIFLDLLAGPQDNPAKADGAKWLGTMNLAGMLGRFIPDWGRIVGQMQFDTYHVFTVDEHTIEAVRVLNDLERGNLADVTPVASALIGQVQSRRALYVAMMLHDIAKGRDGDHSEMGAVITQELGPRLGLTAEETETASWLVLHHLVLSQTAFKRDIDDPKTVLDLAELVQSPERLRLLEVLTVADMRAVSTKVWNNWKATLLREIYWRVAEVLAGGLNVPERDARVARARASAEAALSADGLGPDEIAEFMALGYPAYWLGFDPSTHARHARIVREAADAPLTVRTTIMADRGVTEVTVYAADHPGLFSKVAGALAVAGASIVDARIHTMTNGMALDTFWIQDAAGGSFDTPHRIARMSVLIEQALSGRLRIAEEIRKSRPPSPRTRAIHVPPRVVIDNHASATHTVVEVNGRDRPGFLHDVTAAMSEAGVQIASAHVTTYGVRAVDVFYVKDVFGLKIENERKLSSLKEALLAALEPPPGTVAAAPLPPAGGGAARRRNAAGPA